MEVEELGKVLGDDGWFDVEELFDCFLHHLLERDLLLSDREHSFDQILRLELYINKVFNGFELLLRQSLIVKHHETHIVEMTFPSFLEHGDAVTEFGSSVDLTRQTLEVFDPLLRDEAVKLSLVNRVSFRMLAFNDSRLIKFFGKV